MKPEIRVIAGPTGSGKTALAIELSAEEYEVVSCDSRQIYADMEIGTAAPDKEERSRLTHHLVGIVSPAETMTAAAYRERAIEVIGKILSRGRIPVIVGGTGFYYMALKAPPFDVPPTPELRAELSAMTHGERVERLREVDPGSFLRFHENDQYRVKRALEITLASGKPWSVFWKEAKEREPDFKYAGVRLEPEIPELTERLRHRAKLMIEKGFVDEAVRIRETYGEDCHGLSSLGYREALDCALGRMTKDELIEKIVELHVTYAKSQIKWFRREKELRPVSADILLQEIRRSGPWWRG